MKERPILFNGDMVRAILAGRKAQTRRPISFVSEIGRVSEFGRSDTRGYEWAMRNQRMLWCELTAAGLLARCTVGQPCDRLWVRETHCFCPKRIGAEKWDITPEGARVVYAADGFPILSGPHEFWSPKMRPSIHMPRWASRITLEITGVRVERVQDVSEDDAKAEGLRGITKDGRLVKWGIPDSDGLPGTDDHGWPWAEWCADHRDAFKKIWDNTYAKRGLGWDHNPWVWVVDFRRAEA